MLEIHFYFTPVLNHLEACDGHDWYLHPVVNLNVAKTYRDQTNFPKTVEYLNASYDRLEKIALDYLTINLHGRKYGRQFLFLLQEKLEHSTILNYNNLIRQHILVELGLTTAEFKIFRTYSKQRLTECLREFYKHRFTETPASIILTATEELQIASCQLSELTEFIQEIEKTA